VSCWPLRDERVIRDGPQLLHREAEPVIGDGTRLVLLVNVASTLMLVGLIWFVQIVHYPQFARVGAESFIHYQSEHVRLTKWVVALPMLVEAVTSAILAWNPPSRDIEWACWGGLSMVIVIWVSTAVLQVPRHTTLASGFDSKTHRSLVLSNWIRTVAWSLHGVLVLLLVNQLLAKGPGNG
jgi:hypothetical protein